MCYRTDSLKSLHLIIVLAMVIALSHQALFLIAAYIVKQNPDLIILFSSKSEVSGWLLNESPSKGRLIYLEHLIHNLAVDEGYMHRKDISLGETETAHLLMRMALVIRP